jgi:dihydroxyacetone kinase-like protein
MKSRLNRFIRGCDSLQKIINDPQNVVDEMLEGYIKAMPDMIARTNNKRVVKYKYAPIADKVGIVTGGGSGHKPAFIGYIGRNMVDAVAVGEIFSSPPAQMFYDAFKAADSGKGVACLYGNYAGDNMNVKMAIRMAKADGIEVKTVVANDDVPSSPKDRMDKRRGVAGEVLMWKVAGAKAAMGGDLDEVIAAAQKAIDNTRSMGIGLSPCTIPEVGHPNFKIKEGTMEVGIGHHGEPGLEVTKLETADEIAKRMTGIILPDIPFKNGDEVVVLLSGLGSTTLMELYILYNEVYDILVEKGISVYIPYVGNYFTSLDMAGVTLTIMKLDEELKECIDYESDSMGLRQFARRKK